MNNESSGLASTKSNQLKRNNNTFLCSLTFFIADQFGMSKKRRTMHLLRIWLASRSRESKIHLNNL